MICITKIEGSRMNPQIFECPHCISRTNIQINNKHTKFRSLNMKKKKNIPVNKRTEKGKNNNKCFLIFQRHVFIYFKTKKRNLF